MPMLICPICNLDHKKQRNQGEIINGVPVYKRKWAFKKRPCKDCKELMNESVVLSCSECDSLTLANEDVFIKNNINIRNGDIFEIHSCPHCSEDKKFHFLTPTK